MIYMVHHAYCFPRLFTSRQAAEVWVASNPRPEAWRDQGSVKDFWSVEERELVA